MASTGFVPLLTGRPISQIGVLVADLDAAVSAHSAIAPRERWLIIEPTGGPRPGEHCYRGQPQTAAVRLAFGPGHPEIELIQHVSGPSIYAEWLATHGFGLHHLAVEVELLSDAIILMAQAGFAVLQSATGYGPGGTGGHAYFDTEPALGYLLEAIEPPGAG